MGHMTTRLHVFKSSLETRAYLRLCSHHLARYPPRLPLCFAHIAKKSSHSTLFTPAIAAGAEL